MGLFESDEEKDARLKSEKLMNTPQNKEKTPHPRGDAEYDEENWVEFNVVQENKPIKLHTYRSSPDPKNPEKVKAVVVMFHGLNSYVGASSHIAKGVVKSGVAVVGFDFRGFGKSQGIAGYIESEELHLQDCVDFIKIVEKTYPEKKIFLSGQSLGGLTCFYLALQFPNKFAGQVLFCPAIKDQKENAKFGKKLARFLGYIAPKMQTVPQSGGLANKNPQISDDNANDPYIYKGKIIPGTIRTLLNSMDKAHTLYEKYDTPFLLIQAGVDKLVCPTLVEDLMDRSPAKDKELLWYENAWHNIWAEDEIKDIIPQMAEWLEKRL